ncbi:MAG: sulfur oxidation c-type cytochrome SoxX [Rubrivivax sp.]|jgi:sulfur-oxidizing protein SoxX
MRVLPAIVAVCVLAVCALAGPGVAAQPGAAAAPAVPAARTESSASAGDPQRGQALLLKRHDSGCILCHEVPGIAQGGNLGPPLAGLASRYSAEELRARIADARVFNPATIMPPTRSTAGLQRVAPAFQGQTVLTQQGLEDIVAYLLAEPPNLEPRR